MEIYHVKRTDRWGYDSYSAMVVIALDEEDARNIRPDGTRQPDETRQNAELYDYDDMEWPIDKSKFTVTLIGHAEVWETERVVLASYHAG